jgi:hypothetical protein
LERFEPSADNLPNQTWLSILSGSDLALPPSHYIETLARRWVKAVEIYLSEPERYILVRYEDFNKEKKRCIEILSSQLCLAADQPFERFLDYQFQRPGQASMRVGDFFGHTNLNRIADTCQPTMSKVGYVVCEPSKC